MTAAPTPPKPPPTTAIVRTRQTLSGAVGDPLSRSSYDQLPMESALWARHRDGMLVDTDIVAPGLRASPPEPLPFAPSLHIRSFVLERDAGDLLVYSTTTATGDVWRQYLNHGHEAAFPARAIKAPLFVHAADRAAAEATMPVRA